MGIQLNGNNDNISAVDGDLSITGIVTFSQLDVGNNIKFGNAGVVTATSFVGSGANLTGISPNFTSIASNIVPDSDNARDLGTSSARWNELYIQSIKGNQNQHILYDANGAIEMFANSTQFIGMKVNGKGLEIRNNSRVIPTTSGAINFGDASNKWNEIHANSFHGDGSNLTGVTGTTINSNGANRIITGSGSANTLEANSNFTYTGSVVTHNNPSGLAKLDVKGSVGGGALGASISVRNTNSANNGSGEFQFQDPGSNIFAKIVGVNLTDGSNNGYMSFHTSSATSGLVERLRITDDGKVGINDSTPTVTLETVGHNQVTFGSMPETIMTYGTTSAYNSGSAGSGIQFGGYYNSTPEYTIFGGAHGVKENTTDGHFGGALLFSTRTHGGNSAERVRITSSGKIGINESSPERTIDIKGNNCMVKLEGTGGNGRQYSLCSTDNTTGASVGPAGRFVIYDDTAGADRFTIKSDGFIGINNNDPQRPLHIIGNDGASGATSGNSDTQLLIDNAGTNGAMIEFLSASNSAGRIMFSDTGSSNRGKIEYLHSDDSMRFSLVGLERFKINYEGHLFAPNLNSGGGHTDVRYVTSNGQFIYNSSTSLIKTDIRDCSYGLAEIKQLKPKIYKRTDADNMVEVGLIADEVYPILPEICATEKKSFFTKNEADTEIIPSNWDSKCLAAILTKAIQEQQEQIEILQAKVTALEGS